MYDIEMLDARCKPLDAVHLACTLHLAIIAEYEDQHGDPGGVIVNRAGDLCFYSWLRYEPLVVDLRHLLICH